MIDRPLAQVIRHDCVYMVQKSNYETYLKVSQIYLLISNIKVLLSCKLTFSWITWNITLPWRYLHLDCGLFCQILASNRKIWESQENILDVIGIWRPENSNTLWIHKEKPKRSQRWKDIMCGEIWDGWISWSFHRVRRWRGIEEMQRIAGRVHGVDQN